jgi:hypothetical protein
MLLFTCFALIALMMAKKAAVSLPAAGVVWASKTSYVLSKLDGGLRRAPTTAFSRPPP